MRTHFKVVNNAETRQTVISGIGTAPDVIISKLKTKFSVSVNLSIESSLQETIRKGQGRRKTQSGQEATANTGTSLLSLSPADRGSYV